LELIPQKQIDGDSEGGGPKYAFPLCSWVYHMKLTLIENVLSMGFELDLYQPYEYLLIYGYSPPLIKDVDGRYLGHSYLMHNQQLERIKLHLNIPRKRKSQPQESLYVNFLITRNMALECMCQAYCSVTTAMTLS